MKKLQLRKASRDLVRNLGALETYYGDFSLTPIQIHTLVELGQEKTTISQMAKKLNVNINSAKTTLTSLAKQLLIQTTVNPDDERCQFYHLTAKGKDILESIESVRNKQVQAVIDQFDDDDMDVIETSINKYIKALILAKSHINYSIREIKKEDNPKIAALIRQVSAEYGLTADKGFSVADPTLDSLFDVFQKPNSQYWVIEQGDKVYGGAGIAPLEGSESICELQKMYFLPIVRGKGLSRTLAVKCFKAARKMGFSQIYLETTHNLTEAISLYETLGFKRIEQPLGSTGHTDCEVRMLKTL